MRHGIFAASLENHFFGKVNEWGTGLLGYAVHQCSRFCEEVAGSHTGAVHHIVCFLIGTRDEGIILDLQDILFKC